ncbi:uncharacterized protein LOC124352800 isoform X2 [Homalodisca vitripennis]|uniref:uncharacterized protein LOC124352800 isoform X2 n=1 Tax=Homalodisca vitripennis TaxID=197043 RepID=UPI001EEAB515|nr:uncharacterized protein LOC124352800 isoform X2 [Homalodisca vitripennis]
MDQSNRRKIGNLRRSNLKKFPKEMNGNSQGGCNYKGESIRRQKQTRECYKNEDQDHGRVGDGLPNYMPLHGQRLFAAVSDPAVCGYPVSLGYPYDPIPLSVGYPMYHPPQYTHRMPYQDSVYSPRRSRLRNNHEKGDHSKDTFQTVDEYTSLPPGNLQDIESDQQRRFSDPGLANNTGSEEDSLSNEGSSPSWFEDSQIANQIEALVLENKRLSKELKETQTELQELKLEVSSLTQMQSTCEPGFISDLVREVHEATKIREDTMLARMRVFTENFQQSASRTSSLVELKRECTKECVEKKEQLAEEKDELSKRLARLEEQMKLILTHNSNQETSQELLLQSQKKKQQLEQELKTAVDARKVAEANASSYERLFNSITKRLPNGLVLEEKIPISAAPAVSLDTSESLTSSLGSGSLHSPQVTMSGPVTDL